MPSSVNFSHERSPTEGSSVCGSLRVSSIPESPAISLLPSSSWRRAKTTLVANHRSWTCFYVKPTPRPPLRQLVHPSRQALYVLAAPTRRFLVRHVIVAWNVRIFLDGFLELLLQTKRDRSFGGCACYPSTRGESTAYFTAKTSAQFMIFTRCRRKAAFAEA